MHMCIHFIPELLQQPQPERQIFAVHLLSLMAAKYPTPHVLVRPVPISALLCAAT